MSGARIGDADRERALRVLAHHAGTGVLSLAEFGERSALAAAATTKAELVHVLIDLPLPVAEPTAPAPGLLRRTAVTTSTIAAVVLVITVATGNWLWLFALAAIVPVLYAGRRRLPS